MQLSGVQHDSRMPESLANGLFVGARIDQHAGLRPIDFGFRVERRLCPAADDGRLAAVMIGLGERASGGSFTDHADAARGYIEFASAIVVQHRRPTRLRTKYGSTPSE